MASDLDYGQSLGSLNPDGTFTSAVNEGYLKVLERCRERHVGFMACPSAGPDGQTAADVAKVIEEGCSAAGRTRHSGLQGAGKVKEKQKRVECIWRNPEALRRIATRG